MDTNQQISGSSLQKHSSLALILTPSWLSMMLGVLVALIIVVGTIAAAQYRSSDLQILVDLRQTQDNSIGVKYNSVDNSFSNNSLLNNLPLLILWGGVGYVVYLFADAVLKGFKHLRNFQSTLGYVHSDRKSLVRFELGQLTIRLAALALWVVYLQISLHAILPYTIALAYAGVSLGAPGGIAYWLADFVIIVAGLHLHAILIRLITLRPRVFGV